MTTGDTLNIFLIIALLVVVSCIVYASYFFVKALKSITQLADNLEETTEGIKQKLQMKFFTALPALLLGLAAKIFNKKRG